jgi:hypothetical protein
VERRSNGSKGARLRRICRLKIFVEWPTQAD